MIHAGPAAVRAGPDLAAAVQRAFTDAGRRMAARRARQYRCSREYAQLCLELGDRAAGAILDESVRRSAVTLRLFEAIGPYPQNSLEYLVLVAERQHRLSSGSGQ